MQRTSIVADIFGYIVCLLAVAIFFISAAGVVNNAFRVVHPTAQHRMFAGFNTGRGFGMHRRFGLEPRFGGGWMGRQSGQTQAPLASQSATGTQTPAMNRETMRARFIADARYDAVRRLVVALVMLILSIAVFRRTFQWLNPLQTATT